jgi:tryptophan synthase beta chain
MKRLNYCTYKVPPHTICEDGHFDLAAYETYLSGNLKSHSLTDEEIAASLAKLNTPTIP